MAEFISVVIVDDHELIREGLRSLLGKFDDFEVVGEAGTVEAGVETVLRTRADVLLLDLSLGGEDGKEVARRLRDAGSPVRIVVVSMHDTAQHLRDALSAGADGYLLKNSSGATLAEGIRQAVAGQTVIGQEFVPKLLEDAVQGVDASRGDLTPREREVLDLVAEGLTNREVAGRLGISPRTAQKHLENLFKKFGVHDRTELVAYAFRQGLLA